MAGEVEFDALIRDAKRSALHLEMRDSYQPSDPVFLAWRDGQEVAPDRWRWWSALIKETVGRGVEVRRARIVSEPVTDYIRFEHAIAADLNIAAGEQVRWLPRRRSSDLALPGNDFWLFDGKLVLFNHFTGEGESSAEGRELTSDPAVAKLCATAFEAVWERAIPHEEYQPT